jgi:2-oxoglutarate dehydrogenase E2 component (dihydrolipoamide succinyltransferase)
MPVAQPPGPVPADVDVVPFSSVRRRTAEHMVRSRATSAHAFIAVEVDFHAVDRARHSPAGSGLTYLPFVARAVIDAVGTYPQVNAEVGDDALLVHRHIHLGIAVDLDADGLVVPVVRDAADLNLAGLGRRIASLAAAARQRRLGPDDYAGGTFTISNPGPYGTLLTAPIINQPQVAILATDSVRMRPVAVETASGDHSIVVHPVGTIGLSFDHRVIDGGYAARFLQRVRAVLETRDWQVEL